MYTARPASGAQVDADTIVSAIVSGMPSAVPLRPTKLERMSLRTTPVWFSTLGPFEPSPGYGPAVSSGILLQAPWGVVSSPVLASLQPSSWSAPKVAPKRAAARKRTRRSVATPVADRWRLGQA